MTSSIPASTAFEYASAVDTGRMRSNNEDAVLVDALNGVAVLADGMGGYNAGEVASHMATTYIAAELARWLADQTQEPEAVATRRAVEDCVDSANRAIFNAAVTNPSYAGMGTTLVVAVFSPRQLVLGHVGDSRCYRLRGNQLQQITRDHSLLQEQLDAGLITPEQALYATHKNLVTRAVGVEDAVMVEIHVHEVQPGDLYLMCSDGLTDMLDNNEILFLIQGQDSLEAASLALIDAANQAGGRDNISVILARCEGEAPQPGRVWWPFKR
jgi:PPM family protein phosphatase